MSCKIRYAADGVALDFHVWTEHLFNKRFEAAKFDDEELVVSCAGIIRMGWVQETRARRTVYCQITESSTGCTLNLGVLAGEQEEYRIKRVPTNRTDFFLGDFSKCQCSTALQVDIVRERECCQSGEGGALEEIGCCAICGRDFEKWNKLNESRAYSRGTGGGRQLLHVHSLEGGARTVEICVNGLGQGYRSAGGARISRIRTARLAAAAHDAHGWGESRSLLTFNGPLRGNIFRKLPVFWHLLTLTLNLSPPRSSSMAEPSWQEHIRLRLAERNVKQNAFASIIEQCTLSVKLTSSTLNPY